MQNPEIKEFEKEITILWLTLLLGAMMISIVFVTLIKDYPEFWTCEIFLSGPFSFIALTVAISGCFISIFLYKRQVLQGSDLDTLAEKLAHYRTAVIQRAALIEGPTLLCAVFMYLDRCSWYLGIIIVLLLVQYVLRPSIERFKQDYTLTMAEKNELSGF